ncbi:MAG TPA: dTDP-4-dehydrorhamnose 3,5-epimerase [Flavisolibacter sp.]|jgi:dTDP-4-dehydrorhamnose 3,5-epimerase|nr:dTDP-4-dehydrorhamnose 3,5-epimerase [Flavisolibacter sp.]
MPFQPTAIPGLLIFEPKVFEDSRGYFFEGYSAKVFEQEGLRLNFVQDNQSHSKYGVVRGLHYQLNPHAQAKLIRVLDGVIIDAVVDIRVGSPTFGQTFTIELSAANKKQLLVPVGFAHGFAVISETATVMYKCDDFWNKESEGGIRYDDPALGIDWGVPKDKAVLLDKDLNLPLFADCKNNFVYQP